MKKFEEHYSLNFSKAVTVVDAPCGYGKSEWAIQYMEENRKKKKFIYITPYLSEIDRLMSRLPYFKTPEVSKGKNKSDDLFKLIMNRENIVSTHRMFINMSEDMRLFISSNDYELILDEVVEVVNGVGLGKDAVPLLENAGLVEFDKEDSRLKWIADKDANLSINKEYTDFQEVIKNQDVYLVRDSKLIWTMDPYNFMCFEKVYVLTYMFSSQFQRYYFDWLGIDYRYKSVKPTEETKCNKFPNVRYELDDKQIFMDVEWLKSLINIHESKINYLGQAKEKIPKDKVLNDTSLSSSKLGKMSKKNADIVRKGLENYFKNITKAKADERLWTVVKGEGDKILKKVAGKYTKQHIPINARGTNSYSHKTKLAYISNRFMNPIESAFFQDICKVSIEENGWALSELIQWLYRSAIRNGESIELYIPSIRMRCLLYEWIENGGVWTKISPEKYEDTDHLAEEAKEMFS